MFALTILICTDQSKLIRVAFFMKSYVKNVQINKVQHLPSKWPVVAK